MLIEKNDFNDQTLYEVYKNAYMSPEQDDDGRVRLVVDNVHLSARAMADKPFLALSTSFGLKPEATRMQSLELANRINDKMIMVRCSIPETEKDPFIWIDHFTMTEGGITGEEIVALTRRFVKVILDGFRELDTEDIVH